MNPRKEKFILAVSIIIFIAGAAAVAVWKYFNFGFNGLDLAIYNNTFWNTVHGNWFGNSIHAPSYLGDHAEWLILALAPIYALLPHPLTLVVLKIIALALGAIPVWLIAKHALTDKKFAIFFPLLWLANPYVWNLALFDFHIVTFTTLFILVSAYFFITNKWPWFIAFIVITLLAREDMFLAIFGFSILAFFESDKRNKYLRWIVLPAILAVVIFTIDQTIISHFNPDGAYKFFVYYSWLGATPGAALVGLFQNPLRVAVHLFTFDNLGLMVALLMPFLFLPLMRPRWFIVSVLALGELLMTDTGGNAVILRTQYVALLLPGLAIAAVYGYERVITAGRLSHFRPIVPVVLAAAAVYSFMFFGPGNFAFVKGTSFVQGRLSAWRDLVSKIPSDASVVAGLESLTPLSGRGNVHFLSYVWSGKKQFGFSDFTLAELPDYLVLDQKEFLYYTLRFPFTSWTAPQYATGDDRLRALIENGHYGVVLEEQGVALLKKDANGPWPFVRIADPEEKIEHPAATALGPVVFKGWNRDDKWRLFFTAAEPVTDDLALIINEKPVPLGNGIYPTSEWKPGEVVEISVDDPAARLTLEAAKLSGGLTTNAVGTLVMDISIEERYGNGVTLP